MKNIPLPDNIDQLKALLRQQQVAVEQLNVTMKKQQARLRITPDRLPITNRKSNG